MVYCQSARQRTSSQDRGVEGKGDSRLQGEFGHRVGTLVTDFNNINRL